ncbi:MAG TPA: SusC/RagA family TonB-linked outer membrane protein, partial [Cytophagales bacterium]
PTANTGAIRNRGLEIQAGYNKATGSLRWNVTGNVSFIRNKVVALGDSGATLSEGEQYGDFLTRTEVGQPVAYFRGFLTDGIFQNQAEIDAANTAPDGAAFQPDARPGDIRFKDVNGDGKLDDKDKVNIGHFMPTFTYGLDVSASWKNFDATVFLQGVQGNQIYSVVKYELEGMTRLFNAGTAVLNRWTTEGQQTDVPRAVSGDPNGNARASDRFVEDGSYLRLKNFTLGYSLPAAGLESFTRGLLSKARLYFSSQNLLTLTRYKSGYDPEIGSRYGNSLTNGIDYGQYPQARSLIVGLQVGF